MVAQPITRFRRTNPCPICGGGDDMPRGQQKRCSGYLSSDGRFAYCTREEHAGTAALEHTDPPSYRHILEGECRCGQTHLEARDNSEATYDYLDAAGHLLYQVVRLPGKQFRQRRPAPDGSWLWNLHGVTRVLYRLPDVLAAAAVGETIYIVEGEKDVHAIERAGATATCNSGGAGKWQPEYSTALQGATVIVIADNDKPGRDHAHRIQQTIPTARIVTAAAGKDVSDHLAAGHTLDTLLPLLVDPQDNAPEPEEPPTAFEDLDNAKRLIAKHGNSLHYVKPWDRWLYWSPPVWREDTICHTEALAQETTDQLLQEAIQVPDEKLRARMLREIQAAKRSSRIAGVLRQARARPGVPIEPDQVDADTNAFNVQNGTINLQTLQRHPHDPAALITKSSPADHNQNAQSPQWNTFLQRVLPDPATREFLQRAVGYSLLGGNPDQILLILYGSGANGKSTFLEITRTLFGDYGQQAPPETFLAKNEGIPNDVARLRGARFVAAVEIGEGRRLNEPLIKRMTGGDTMTARFMRQEFFEFQPQFTPWLATNHKPEIHGTDEAIWRRIRLVPFTETIPPAERDGNLKDKLRTELPGILNWALDGCHAYQQDGLAEPETVKAATAEYRADQDDIGAFITDTCQEGPTQRCLASDLYNAYREWTKTNGTDPMTAQSLGRRLTERGYTRNRDRLGRGWQGIDCTGSTERLI